MDLERLHELVLGLTFYLGEGENMEHWDEAIEVIDVLFSRVGVKSPLITEEVKDELRSIMRGYPDLRELSEEPNSFDVGKRVGGSFLSLRLFALGKAAGLWDIVKYPYPDNSPPEVRIKNLELGR